MPPPIQIHLYRTYVRHYVARLAVSIDYPVTGVVVVPQTVVTGIDEYIKERQTVLAQLRMVDVMVKTPGYQNMVATMSLDASQREKLGIAPRMPPDGLFHTPTAAACEACLTIALCDRNLASYQRLRTRLEEICGNVTKFDADFCQALTLRLNSYSS